MVDRRNTMEFFRALEQRVQAIEMMEMKNTEMKKRYAIPDLEDQREKHSDNGDVVRDAIIGFADGLTVPFALTAGLSS